MPRTGTVRKYAGAMIQWTLNAYTITKMMPTRDVNRTLMLVAINFSTSVRTF